MSVRVEFYGVPRSRSGRAEVTLAADGEVPFSAVLAELARQLPEFGTACVQDGRLARGVLASRDGQSFVTDPETPILPGEVLLIMSSDAGG